MREITAHKVNGVNDGITIEVIDDPGPGGANHEYNCLYGAYPDVLIKFQKGCIAEAGVNGLTHEVLLAIVADRLQSFQAGPFPCLENERALAYTRDALEWLQKRTKARVARGVEGKVIA